MNKKLLEKLFRDKKGTAHNLNRDCLRHPSEKSVQIQKREEILRTNKSTYYKVIYYTFNNDHLTNNNTNN